jgi:molybdopterin molybdotransferase
MLSFAEAQKAILEKMPVLPAEPAGLLDALGQSIAEEIVADRALPPLNHSTMDGYAVRSVDTQGASPGSPVGLAVVMKIPAGTVAGLPVGPGQAARIMTGAPLPAGADAVVPQEQTRFEDDCVLLLNETKPGQRIRKAGEEIGPGETVLTRGTVVRSAEVAMLASLGRETVLVHRRPRIGIVATGDELVPLGEAAPPGKIPAGNGHMLAARVRECGAIPLQTGIARDDLDDLAGRFRDARPADLLVSTGGVSAGDYDLVKEVMQAPGNRLHFWKVAIQPGRPLAFGSLGGVPMIALPGSPAAVLIGFEQFVKPAIFRLMGRQQPISRTVEARITEAFNKERGVRRFIPASIRIGRDGVTVTPAGARGTGFLKSYLQTSALIVLPEDTTLVKAGDPVAVQLLDA